MPTDYGVDVSTFAGVGCDLDPTFGLISGPRVVLEQVARSLVGLVQGALNAAIDETALRVIQSTVNAKASEDERVLQATSTVSFNFNTQTLTVSVRLDLITDETFSLVMNVSAVTVDIILGGDL